MSAKVMGGTVGNHALFKAPAAPNPLKELAPNTVEKIAASDAELARVLAEVRKIASRTRLQNKNYSALSRRSPFISRWETWMAEETKVGLPNPGDLCYRNVIFQILAHTPALIHWAYWYSKHHIPEGRLCELGENGSICKPCYLHAFLTGYWDSRERDFDIHIEKLWDVLFNGWKKEGSESEKKEGQQDPSEFLMDIIYQIWGDVQPAFQMDYLDILNTDVVGARQCKGSGCCKNLDYQYQAGWPVLPITFNAESKVKTITEAFETHLGQEDPVGECEKCHCDQFEKMYISKPAEVFTIQLNRTGTDGKKIENPISFNDTLTVRGEFYYSEPGSGTPPNIVYELTSVVLHSGGEPHEGHYTVAVRGRTNKWTLIDDTTTTPIHFGTFSRDIQSQKNAYMFVYTRRDRHPTDDKMLRHYKIFTMERHRKERGQPEPGTPKHIPLNWSGFNAPRGTSKTMTEIIMGDESEELETEEYSSSEESVSASVSVSEEEEEEVEPMEVEYVKPPTKQVRTMTSQGTQTEAWPQYTAPTTQAATEPSIPQPRQSTSSGFKDLKRPLMTNDDFSNLPECTGNTQNGLLRIQFFKYKKSGNSKDPLEYEIPIDLAVRGFPINLLEDPMDNGIRVDIKQILKNEKSTKKIINGLRQRDSDSDSDF